MMHSKNFNLNDGSVIGHAAGATIVTDIDKIIMPVAPLKDLVLFPYMAVPLFVGRERSTNAVETAYKTDNKQIIFVLQKDPFLTSEPLAEDLQLIGTKARIIQSVKLSDGSLKILVEGLCRVVIKEYFSGDSFISADIQETSQDQASTEDNRHISLLRTVKSSFFQLSELAGNNIKDIVTAISADNNLDRVLDIICAHMQSSLHKKQELLACFDVVNRAEIILDALISEIEITKLENNIRERVKSQIEKNQREYYLSEQMKAIAQEMGNEDLQDYSKIEERIKKSGMSEEAREKTQRELRRLKGMQPSSSESAVIRTYIETLLELPWDKTDVKHLDLQEAVEVLNKTHFGLQEVKERVVDYLAVHQRTKTFKGPIICLLGPPGVGKTSIASSIAEATGRKYVRVSLGGVRDEAEIRGHRRTYIGAIPGTIMQKIISAKTSAPLILLDEIDKISQDFRGDPSSCLLEVLDPQQNFSFRDHYLDVNFDLSQVMFIATANTLNIHPALVDRMEIIELEGYTEEEKIKVARNFLIPKIFADHGIKKDEVSINNASLRDIVRYYTFESGMRGLQKAVEKIARKSLHKIISEKITHVDINLKNLKDFLGEHIRDYGMASKKDEVGLVNGLAWTSSGQGDLLHIEAITMAGSGKFEVTGNLGEVMEESAKAAYTVVKSIAKSYGVDLKVNEIDIHLHFPEGGIPKDGPSAGAGIAVAILSAISGFKVAKDVAMTGEITLRGEVIAIGGVKEKILAAMRAGIKKVILPLANKKDVLKISDLIKDKINVVFVHNIKEVVKESLTRC